MTSEHSKSEAATTQDTRTAPRHDVSRDDLAAANQMAAEVLRGFAPPPDESPQ